MSEKLALNSEDILADRVTRLREEFPEVVTEGKIDFDKLKEALGEEIATDRGRYGLSWAGKSEAIRNVQTPSVGTLVPDREESVNFDTTENLFIEGDNLEVLKLLQKSYHGRVKMIYIDPPYNTGNQFIYPDNFREGLEDYLRYSGQVSSDGFRLSTNTETSGRYHSKWLNMMYPRLFLARNLLHEDGVIFVSIDDHEVHNLRLLMDEIFGEENFVATIAWQKVFAKKNKALISGSHDYIAIYARELTLWSRNLLPRNEAQMLAFKNPDDDPRGSWQSVSFSVQTEDPERRKPYRYEVTLPSGRKVKAPPGRHWNGLPERFHELLEDNRLWFGSNGDNPPRLKVFASEVQEGIVPDTWWPHEDVGNNQEAKKEILELFANEEPYSTPKPTRLIRRMLQISSNPDTHDIVLDFFAGSGTTAHSVLQLNRDDGGNRRFLLVQLPEPTGNPDYPTIAEIGKERVRRVIKKLNEEDDGELKAEDEPSRDRGLRVFKLTSSNFEIWDSTEATPDDIDELAEQLRAFADNVKPDRSREEILYEILLKAGFPLTAPVETIQVAGEEVFAVEKGALLVCLAERVDEELLNGLVELEPVRVVCLDTAFHGNDRLKTNAVLEMKDWGIEFRTV